MTMGHTKEEMREYRRIMRLAFPEQGRLACKKWQKANPEKYKACHRRYRELHKEKYREIDRKRQAQKTIYIRNKRRSDLNFRLASQLRGRMNAALTGKNKAFGTKMVLGCSIEDFKIYIESKFEPGMTWENHGRNGWHIDHIIPCAIFDLTKPEHQKVCFHFSNMQPLWAKANLSKSKKRGYPNISA